MVSMDTNLVIELLQLTDLEIKVALQPTNIEAYHTNFAGQALTYIDVTLHQLVAPVPIPETYNASLIQSSIQSMDTVLLTPAACSTSTHPCCLYNTTAPAAKSLTDHS
eukprot:1138071-Pelagomonas_calceolata.AAC.5